MARRYNLEELLELQHSPLVKVPHDFPPVEEWMGPTATRHNNNNNNNNNREQNDPNNGHAKSFSFGYPRHASRGSNSENLVLGPPKTSFASAFRYFGKSGDSIDRPPRTDDGKNAFNLREKPARDSDREDEAEGTALAAGDKETERKDGRFSTTTNLNGRRNNRDDREGSSWKTDRVRRDLDDPGSAGGGNGEKKLLGPRSSGDRWDIRDKKDREGPETGNFRNFQRDAEGGVGRYQPRRDRDIGNANNTTANHQERRKRENRLSGIPNDEDDKAAKSSDWRRGNNPTATAPSDKEWKHAKYDQSPEWLDASGTAVPETPASQVRTQEDFQRWKEQMKSGAKAEAAVPAEKEETVGEEKDEDKGRSDAEKLSIDTEGLPKSNSSKNTSATPSGPSTSASRDAGIDQFFSKWAQKVAAETSSSPLDPNSMIGSSDPVAKKDKPMPTKSSRFAGIFNNSASPVSARPQTPKVEPSRPPIGPPPSSSTVPKTTEADQEGFQRILQMLGGVRVGVAHNENSRSSSVVPQPSMSRPSSSIFDTSKSSIASHSPHISYPPSAPPGFEGLNINAVGSQRPTPRNSPKPRVAPPSSESEFLARLMQQPRLSQSHQGLHSHPSTVTQSGAPAPQYPAPPGLKTANGMFLNDPAIASISAEGGGAHGASSMKHKDSSHANFVDEFPLAMGQNSHTSPPMLRQNPLGGPRIPLQRPPGFESIQSPPGFVNQPQQQHGGADGHPMLIPPSLPQAPPSRAVNPNFQGQMPGPFPPNRPPMYSNFAPPPNYMAPPGFMAAAAAAAAAGFPPPPPHPQALPHGPLPTGSNFPPRHQLHGMPSPQGHPAPHMAGPGNDPMYPGMNMNFNPAALAAARGSPAFPPPPMPQPVAAGTPHGGSVAGAGVGGPPPGLGGMGHPLPPGMQLNNAPSDDYIWAGKEMGKR